MLVHSLNKSRFGLSAIISLSLALVLFSSELHAQPEMMPPMMQGPSRGRNAEPENPDAAYTRDTAEKILQRVITLEPLTPEEINFIQGELQKISTNVSSFDPLHQAYFYMSQAYLAFYSNNPQQALNLMQQAAQISVENNDILDSLILMSLYYQRFDIATTALQQRGAGVALNPIDNSAPSEWARGAAEQSSSSRGRSSSSRSRTSSQSILNLPVELMGYIQLGRQLSQQPVMLQALNGSIMPYQPGQNKVWCVMFWQVPPDDGRGRRRSTPSRRSSPSRSMPMIPGMPGTGSPTFGPAPATMGPTLATLEIPEVADDLYGNMDQLNELFSVGALNDNMRFLGVNLNHPAMKPAVVEMLVENPWPWPTIMVTDDVNARQWSLQVQVTPVLMLVTPDDTISYIGPVGGFLPRLLLQKALRQAQQQPPTSSQQNTLNQMMGSLNQLMGNQSDTQQTAAPDDQAASQPAPQQTYQPPAASAVQEKTSNPQAQQMMQTAHLNARIGARRKALELCDQVLDRFPDSLEADEARLLIESILSREPLLKKERQEAGKYVGS